MDSLLTRMTARGFTVTADGLPCALYVTPYRELTAQQKTQIREQRDDLLLDVLFPPVDASEALAAFHRLASGSGELYS